MQFLYPGLLYALGAIAIPILVHLFNFRKFKKVQFSNVEYLKEIKQETKSKSKIKHFLILCARVLALACIVLAFAQPFIPSDNSAVRVGKKTVGIYIDNSFSTESESKNGTILEISKNKALEIIKYHSATDLFQLITNDFEGKHQRWLTKEEIAEYITEIDYSSISRNFAEVYSRHKESTFNEEVDQRVIYALSDLQKSVVDLEDFKEDTLLNLLFVPTPSAYNENIWIDSLWFDSPSRSINAPEELNVRIKNSLKKRRENIPLKLYINGTQKAVLSFSADPGLEKDTILTYSNSASGFKNGRVSLEDYPITFDDEYYFGYEVSEKVNVLEITADESKAVSKLFKSQSEYSFTSFKQNQVDYNRFSEFDLIICNQLSSISSGLRQELSKFSEASGSIVIIPAVNAEITSYNSLFSIQGADLFSGKKNLDTKVSSLDFDNVIYKKVFDDRTRNMPLPKVSSYFSTTNNNLKRKDLLLKLQNGDAFLTRYERNGSSFYVFSTSLNTSQSELASNALWVYTMTSIADNAKSSGKISFELGEENEFYIKTEQASSAESIVKLSSDKGDEFIPEFNRKNGSFQIFPGSQAKYSGTYAIKSGEAQIGTIGINYSRKESEISYFDAYDLKQEINRLGLKSASVISGESDEIRTSIKEVNEGKTLWKSFVIMALLFLGIEIMLIKFWK